jgi:cellulose synthase/poly-beta-1,6-N-acetylglucosamine synthase-like glycosyltransferase
MVAIGRLDPRPDEVLVVDNTEGNEETKQIAMGVGARYVTAPIRGLSRARNRGLAESQGEIVAFVDDDALPTTGWLGRILEPFADPKVAGVTGDTVTCEAAANASMERPSRSLSNQDPLWFEIANFGGLGFGTNMALRKEYCRGDRFFDERLGRGAPISIAEESHAFTRLLSSGYHAVHVPAAVVLHPDKPRDVQMEATTSFAYWLFLFFNFPSHRSDLLRFLGRRLRRKPLSWPRDPQGPGEVISSGLWVKLKATIAGLFLFLRASMH